MHLSPPAGLTRRCSCGAVASRGRRRGRARDGFALEYRTPVGRLRGTYQRHEGISVFLE